MKTNTLTYRKVKNAFLCLVWIGMGFYENIFGVTLKDLALLYDTSIENLSRARAGLGIGGLVAIIFAGFVADKFERWLNVLMIVGLVTAAIATAVTPFTTNLDLLWFLSFLSGVAVLLKNVAGSRLVILMWKEKAPTPMHALHMGFGIGAVVIPLIANPFLAAFQDIAANATTTVSVPSANNTTTYMHANASAIDLDKDTSMVVVQESRAQYVYVIVAAYLLLMCIPFGAFQYFETNERLVTSISKRNRVTPKMTLKVMLNPVTYTGGSLLYGVAIYILLLLYYAHVVGGEQMFGMFVRSFSVDVLQFSKDNASYLNMVYWLSFAAGRFLASVVSHFVHIKKLIIAEVILNVAATSIVAILSAKSATTLWVVTVLQGVLISPLYPSGLSYANTFMVVSGVCIAVSSIGANLGYFVYVWVAGMFYDRFGPSSIRFVMLASGVLTLLTMAIFLVLTRRGRPRSLSNDDQKEQRPPESVPGSRDVGLTDVAL